MKRTYCKFIMHEYFKSKLHNSTQGLSSQYIGDGKTKNLLFLQAVDSCSCQLNEYTRIDHAVISLSPRPIGELYIQRPLEQKNYYFYSEEKFEASAINLRWRFTQSFSLAETYFVYSRYIV